MTLHLLVKTKQLKMMTNSERYRYTRYPNCSYHRTAGWLRLGGTSGGHRLQPPCSSRVTHSRLPRTMSRRLLSTSKDGDSTTSLGSLCQCSATLTVTECFLMFRGNLLCVSLCPLPLVLSLGTAGKSLAPSSSPPRCRCKYTWVRSP